MYLKKKAGKLTFFKDQVDEIKELAVKSGYNKFNKFVEHRKEFHKMKRKIPLGYLEAIDAELEVIKFTIELDKKEYEEALEIPLFPKYFTVKMMSAFYRSIKLPGYFSEEEAIEFIREYANKENKICWINYPKIKTITAFPNGNVSKIYYTPDITINNEYIIPKLGGEEIGKVYLG